MTLLAENKVTIVTGGARGIGRATSLLFAKEGSKVVVSDILESEGMETVQMIQNAGGEAQFISCDTASEEDVALMVERTISVYGRVDNLVNNAGVEHISTIIDMERSDFDRLSSINLRGVWLCMKYVIKAMLKHGNKGSIVNMSSLAGNVGYAGLGAYVMSKHGVNGLTKVAAIEHSADGIRTNSICPGCIQTPMIDNLAAAMGNPEAKEQLAAMHPIGRLGTADEIAEAIVWVCSERASFVTGSIFTVDGGWVAQ
ncbi:glucose 1-dehydrogenase [Aliiglaciecola sp. M165]|uniref:glucose 1-dehydrogenase n=1 Tax=Aliiglaciecola sp. M165 TaxID=2593649 RepID=UPI00117D5615|nr:glucose 1-dehydrogenase [Aliiglaciecola sp. M165]TRY33069.1 glucose 1-dehydrogenase [Aliiglaciecola sp. M165]